MSESMGNLALAQQAVRALQSRFKWEVVDMSDLTDFERRKQEAIQKLRAMDRDPDELIGMAEVLNILKTFDIEMARSTIHDIIKREAIPSQMIGTVRLVRFAEIEKIVAGLKPRGGQPKS